MLTVSAYHVILKLFQNFRIRLALVGATVLFFIVIFPFVHEKAGPSAGALITLIVFTSSVLLGVRGGLVIWALTLPLYIIEVSLLGTNGFKEALDNWPGILGTLILAVIAGSMKKILAELMRLHQADVMVNDERLKKINRCFLTFDADPDQNIKRLTSLAREIFDAECAVYTRHTDGQFSIVGFMRGKEIAMDPNEPGCRQLHTIIGKKNDHVVCLRKLQTSALRDSMVFVREHRLQTYAGKSVRIGRERTGSLCVLFEKDVDLRTAEKEIFGILTSAIAVEEKRNRVKDALHESEERFRVLFEGAPDAILLADTVTRKIIDANNAAAVLLARSRSEIVGMYQHELHPAQPDNFPKESFARHVTEAEVDGFTHPIETLVLRPDGSRVQVEVLAQMIRLNDQTVLMGTFRDITERRTTEHLLRDMQRRESIGVLSSGIAHDFNNLLGAMMGNISLAQAHIPVDHPATRNMEKAISAMERAANLTKQMLAYSGKGKLQNRTIDVVAMVQEYVSLFTVSLAKNVRLVTHLPAHPVYVNGDPSQIEQIIMNLIINGGDAIGEKQGVVSVTLTPVAMRGADLVPYCRITNTAMSEGAYILLEVNDTGMGMAAETMNKIFDPFFTTKFTGRGLGLSAVLGILQGHKGGITVESREGAGTTFRLLLPTVASPAAADEQDGTGTSARGDGTQTILIIDDELDVATMAREIVETEHYTALVELNPIVGIERYRMHHADIALVLLDLTMPEMSGKEVVDALHAIDSDVQIIISSGYSEDEVVKKIGTSKVSGFIQKPYRLQSLLALVHKVTR